ncbi:MarR family winged helix-turn-helix transcriptional regulator [Acidaminobacter hydrogenoformans]|uniref:DNA-binding transcriptional regulator, MarR family n=1 Tax=Acidaminobacter hydrogenoformans DSM 2784 TaxID=1120920 RepID=A0A1G5RZR8_9FIRM|nr:MarR family transcriptional regulator [Acidaminobacter hydrogenoformans]SCZ79358.1 DNA-binding transcriptional regulator, MarR family [Acidaminobacter hydrogenoformans DSM 2784]
MSEASNEKKYIIAKLFHELSMTVKQTMRREFESLGLTMPQSMVIGMLIKRGTMKVSELSEALGFTNSTVSGILDRLEKQGIVQRDRSPEDRRVVYISITDAFLAKHKGFSECLTRNFENLLQGAEEEELSAILKGLTTLQSVLKSQEERPL